MTGGTVFFKLLVFCVVAYIAAQAIQHQKEIEPPINEPSIEKIITEPDSQVVAI